MNDKGNFLGAGWGFPPTFNPVSASVDMVSNETDVRQSLQILLSTRLGERVLQPDFGCDLSPLLYELITETLLTKIRGMIKDAILKYEQRIDLDSIDFEMDGTIQGMIKIDLAYTIRSTNSRHNYVFPYYLEEGTYVKQ